VTIFGREAYLPENSSEWVRFSLVLFIAIVAFRIASGWSTALLGGGTVFASFLYDHHLYLPGFIALAGVIAVARGVRAGQAPAGWRALRETLYVAGGFVIYEWGRAHTVGEEAVARANAVRIIDIEKAVGLYFEGSLQSFALRAGETVRALNWFYSFAFLSIVIGALLYLYVVDHKVYQVYRTSLGISALLALITIALMPVAPPRLVPESGLFDTHNLLGRSHGFVNPFAALPSLHVGWVALAGYALSRVSRGAARPFWATAPALTMLATVVATGNHYWVDGVVGAAYSLAPAVLLLNLPNRKSHRLAWICWPNLKPNAGWISQRTSRVSLVAIGSLLTYLLIRQAVDRPFTDYWGYMVAQLAASIVLLVWLDNFFAAEGGLSWLTHLVVIVNAWADSLGTAAHMYDKYVSYDKITHFLGGIMIAAAVADILFALSVRRGWDETRFTLLTIAVGVSIGIGTAWEVYEYYGDLLFDTGRHAGALDTRYDLISDLAGAICGATMYARWHLGALRKPSAGSVAIDPQSQRPSTA
jgi:uncharacterized protein YfiM (DUF2279 family)